MGAEQQSNKHGAFSKCQYRVRVDVICSLLLFSLQKSESVSCSVTCDSDSMDCSLLGSSVHGILQARILDWAAMPFFRNLSKPGIEPKSAALQADSLLSEPTGK